MPDFWPDYLGRPVPGDACGNCRRPWPCGCDDPVHVCGICGGDQHDCCCDERMHVTGPDEEPWEEEANEPDRT